MPLVLRSLVNLSGCCWGRGFGKGREGGQKWRCVGEVESGICKLGKRESLNRGRGVRVRRGEMQNSSLAVTRFQKILCGSAWGGAGEIKKRAARGSCCMRQCRIEAKEPSQQGIQTRAQRALNIITNRTNHGLGGESVGAAHQHPRLLCMSGMLRRVGSLQDGAAPTGERC